MESWNPFQLFLATNAYAFLAAFAGVVTAGKPTTLWQALWSTVKLGLVGATSAPFLAALPIHPAVLARGERLLFWSTMTAAYPAVRKFALKKITGEQSDD